MDTRSLTLSKRALETKCREIHDSSANLNPNHLVKSLTRYSKIERKEIRETYKAMYNDAITTKSLQKLGTSNVCAEALWLWMMDQHERDAILAREAIECGNPNYMALVEIFASRKSSHILLINQAYLARFRRQLDQDIINLEPPHAFQKILIALSTSHKAHEQADASQHIAKCDARRLYKAGEGGSGAIDAAVVLEILSKRSIQQTKLTFASYKHIYGHDYIRSLENGNSREFEDALKCIINCISNPHNYYAKAFYRSIKETCDKRALLHILMSKAETTDLKEIKLIFKNKYGTELKDAIHEHVPFGDYRDFLLGLATKNSS